MPRPDSESAPDRTLPQSPGSSDSQDSRVEAEMRKRSRRGFLVALLAAGGAYGGWRWLIARPRVDGLAWPFRRSLSLNEALSGKLFDPNRRVAEVRRDAIPPAGPRVNGDIGLEDPPNLTDWRLRIVGTELRLQLDDLRTLPQTSQATPLNCIEGWTTAARWTGVRFADFVDRFYPSGRSAPYVGLATPDGSYYVGLDAASAFHSQTLLCHAINDEPLSPAHGAPLRLLVPTKYGIKNLKRVGFIEFAQNRPPDYWAERGYDWFAGL